MASSTFKVGDKVRIKSIRPSWEAEYCFHVGDVGEIVEECGGGCVVRFTRMRNPDARTPTFGLHRLWIPESDLEKYYGLLDI